jgi:hypothetical protein
MKKTIGLVGLMLFIASIFLGASIVLGEQKAVTLNDEKKSYGMISDEAPPQCSWSVKAPEQLMSESKTQAIVIKATNSNEKKCESSLTLRSPGFDINPMREEQKISLESKMDGSISWILTPRKSGTYQISVSDAFNTSIFGITVTNVFGLTAFQAKLFSTAGGIFGPMLTFPWWIEKWFQRKQKQENRKNSEEQKNN